jgi:hypothetical protein
LSSIKPSDHRAVDAATWLAVYDELKPYGPRLPSEWLGIPIGVTALVGLLWAVPVPTAFDDTGGTINWGTLFLMATIVYYFILSISLAFGLLPFLLGAALVNGWLDSRGVPLGFTGAATFIVVLVWQLSIAARETLSMHLFRHIQYLMIGPLWLLAAVYRRFGIPY